MDYDTRNYKRSAVLLLRRSKIDEDMKNAIRDIMLQRLKNEAEFCPDSKDNKQ